jgi:hypothetical protein
VYCGAWQPHNWVLDLTCCHEETIRIVVPSFFNFAILERKLDAYNSMVVSGVELAGMIVKCKCQLVVGCFQVNLQNRF